ncbi:MAG: signal peptidase II [Chloroflexi bacterium RBG_16_48_8]|nr:MAG: signal peptidase II [Chloroflexi bacterium RBG_16_48_8]
MLRYNLRLEIIWEHCVKNIQRSITNYLFLFGISGIIVGLDQWTKHLVRISLELGEEWVPLPDITPFLRIVHWKNTGAAFGLLPQASVIFTVIAILVALAIIYYWPRIPSNQFGLRIALALQLGGALGNLISRLSEGIVTDWIAVGNFPVFNVADSSISVGVAVLVIATWRDERRKGEESVADVAEEVDREDRAQEADPAV